jgi:glycosyltransferase involved in cell wall biosynthesis
MTSEIKIFLIIPTLKQGGAERVISELANAWVDWKNVSVSVVTLAKSEDFYTLKSGIKVHRLGFENKGFVKKFFSVLLTFISFRKLLTYERPTYVLSFMERYNSFVLLASFKLDMRVYVSDRSNPLKNMSFLNESLRRFTYRYASGIISQTQLAKDRLFIKTANSNIRVIPNPLRNVLRYPEYKRDNIVVTVGRMVPEKGQKHLIEAFALLNRKDWRLLILGDGKLKEELTQLADSLGILGLVEMPGAVCDVDHWLAKASIFAFPSISEGFPNALVEAMAAGLPCVSFDCNAGPKDIIRNNENGILISEGDVLSFSHALKSLIDDERLRIRMGNAALDIRNDLDLVKISKSYMDFMSGET